MRANRASWRLAHGWQLFCAPGLPEEVIREFVRPAVRAVPRRMAARLGFCRISLAPYLEDSAFSSQWTQTDGGLEIALATAETEGHDLALELLLCLGQALWEKASDEELEAHWRALRAEVDAGVSGEIEEEALREKRLLLSSRVCAQSTRRLERYARAAFAATVAEYVHCLWHEVTVRVGPDHLPPSSLGHRLKMLAGWFPPDRGYRLFPRRAGASHVPQV